MTGANLAGLGLNVGQTSEQLSASVLCGDPLGCDSATDVGMEDFFAHRWLSWMRNPGWRMNSLGSCMLTLGCDL